MKYKLKTIYNQDFIIFGNGSNFTKNENPSPNFTILDMNKFLFYFLFMKVIIPVAGIGSRLRPHTHLIPKVLMKVAGKPIIDYLIDSIADSGLKDFIFIVGYLGDLVKEHLLSRYPNLNIKFAEQTERKGLAHAVQLAKSEINMNEESLIILGDSIFKTNFKEIISTNCSTLGVVTVDDPSRFGVIIKDNDIITNMIEKPDKPVSNLAICGIYKIKNTKLLFDCIDEIINSNIKTKGEYQLTDALMLMINKGEKITTYPVEKWLDCGLTVDLLYTNKEILEENRNEFKPSVNGSIIIPPVFIGKEVVIENSVIGPYVSISDNVIIKESVIKNSIISMAGKVENMLLDSSVVGQNAMVKGKYSKLNIGDSSEINFDF